MNTDAVTEARQIAAVKVADLFNTTPAVVLALHEMDSSTLRPEGDLAGQVAQVAHPDTVVSYLRTITTQELSKITNNRMLKSLR